MYHDVAAAAGLEACQGAAPTGTPPGSGTLFERYDAPDPHDGQEGHHDDGEHHWQHPRVVGPIQLAAAAVGEAQNGRLIMLWSGRNHKRCTPPLPQQPADSAQDRPSHALTLACRRDA